MGTGEKGVGVIRIPGDIPESRAVLMAGTDLFSRILHTCFPGVNSGSEKYRILTPYSVLIKNRCDRNIVTRHEGCA